MSLPPQYSDNPPAAAPAIKKYGATPDQSPSGVDEPLLAQQSSMPRQSGLSGPSGNAWMDQPGEDDLPDDFKVGVAVIDCDTVIRLAFIRKVYSILFIQLLATVGVSMLLSLPAATSFMQQHAWIIWIPMLGSFASLGGVYWKRHHHPANLILLGLFTMFESAMIGTVVSYYESRIVIQALLITIGIFVGLTLFTFQTKWDFSSLGPFLFAGIMGLLTVTLVQVFLPFNANVDLAVAGFSVVLFSGFVLYDTQQIMKRLSPDEHILGSLTLYVDALNLFLSVLRVLNNSNNR